MRRDNQNWLALENKLTEFGAMDAIQRQKHMDELVEKISDLEEQHGKIQSDIKAVRELTAVYNEQAMLIEFGLYTPHYDFMTSDHYKSELEKIRVQQKEMIKNGTAVSGSKGWTVNGSQAKGSKMVKDMQKLLLRAFNGECDGIVNKVKYNNFDASLKRITTSSDAVSKLGTMMSIAINRPYYNLKIDELRLAFEYQQKKQQEREEQKELRAQMREEEKLRRELEREREKIQKEQSHYQNALKKINLQLESASDEARDDLLARKSEIEAKIEDAEKAIKEVDYREANQKAGYVYIVSNIGSFGEDVYKIGMTRRLDPQDRIDELGSASVPFNFDIHAMIFSEDAPKLEAALHRAFEAKKLNWVNTRREFFNVTLDEIKDVINKNYDKIAEFIELADAEQYRVSQKMKNIDGSTAT